MAAPSKTFLCATCGGSFPSRNKLYRHLEESGHGVEGRATPGDGAAAGICVDNAAFKEYYRRQSVCANDAAWADAYQRFQQPLPIAVRCSLSAPAGRLCAALLSKLTQLEPVSWCDGAFIVDLRRSGSSPSTTGAIVLAAAQEIGALQRQELVSCLPPLLLDAQPEHIIADLCAAPGSKSLQILDALHAGLAPAGVPQGLIVANETERSRLLTMCQRARRLPRAPFLALCTDARYFPGMRRRVAQDTAAQGWKQKYDRVLADVPCSGDGTLRKNRTQWRKWSVKDGLSLHYLQLKILKRGIELLGNGGSLVYSTCTLNPIEDEAVVAAALEHFGTDFVELQPLPSWMLDEVKPCNGLSEWLVPAPTFSAEPPVVADDSIAHTTGSNPGRTMYAAFLDVPQKDKKTGGKGSGMLGRTMFPPPDAAITSQLHRCGRVLPTCVDSGGFFVAIIKRLRGGVPNVFVPPSEPESEPEPEPEAEPEAVSEPAPVPEPASELEIQGAEEIREGDWLCPKKGCATNNFAHREVCFKCKANKPSDGPAGDDREEEFKAVNERGTSGLDPLLVRFADGVSKYGLTADIGLLTSFADAYGLISDAEAAAAAGVARFPLESVRLLRRPNQRVLVLASEALDRLAISDKWTPATELGLFLAALPTVKDQAEAARVEEAGGMSSSEQLPKAHQWQIYDEAAAILAQCATKRVLRLPPPMYLRVLEAAVLEPPEGTTEIELTRITHTINRPVVAPEKPWWQDASVTRLLAEMVAPGCIIVKCDVNLDGECGHFSVSARLEANGETKVTVQSSSRLTVSQVILFDALANLD